MRPTEFQVSWHFGSGEEAKKKKKKKKKKKLIFKMASTVAILDFRSERFGQFLIYTQCFLPSLKSIALLVQEKKRKVDFQGGRHGGISDRNDFSYF